MSLVYEALVEPADRSQVDADYERIRLEEEERYRKLRTGRFINILAGGLIGAGIFAGLAIVWVDELQQYLEKSNLAMGLATGFLFAAIGAVVAYKLALGTALGTYLWI